MSARHTITAHKSAACAGCREALLTTSRGRSLARSLVNASPLTACAALGVGRVVVGEARHAARVGRVQAQLEQLKLRNDPDTHGGEETGTRVSTSHERRSGICPRGILHLWQLTMLDGNRVPESKGKKNKHQPSALGAGAWCPLSEFDSNQGDQIIASKVSAGE